MLEKLQNYPNKIFRLVGESMRELRSSMMEAPVPETIKEVIRKIIPPKGINEGIQGFNDGSPRPRNNQRSYS